MSQWRPTNLRSRLTFWYVGVLAILLLVYAALVFAFQYGVLTKQIVHDEIQDVVTVEGLLYFDQSGTLQLRQDYYSRPQSHLLIDRLMEVRDESGAVLYRSPTLQGRSLGGQPEPAEGDANFNEHIIRLDDGTHVLRISHIHGMNGHTLLIRLGYSLAPLRARMVQFLLTLLVAIPIALVIAGAAGQAIARRALRPVERMASTAEHISAENLSERLLTANSNDELGHLAQTFNHLLDRLEQSFTQLQRFTADAAHELRTPIAALRTIGEVALEESGNEAFYRETLSSILEETARLNETIDGLLLLARAEAVQAGHTQEVWPLKQVVDEVLNLLEVLIEEKGIRVLIQNENLGLAGAKADHSLLRTALMNVVHNAVKFSPNKGTIKITYAATGTAHMRELIIEDEGPGIAPGEHERVFERFFTSSARDAATQSGTGLGLSVAKLIVERLGGTIRFDSDAVAGACCILELPTSQ